jgi:cyclic pyranopterin phosphate synthase
MNKLSHVDRQGNPTMVDVSDKKITLRTAEAETRVRLGQEIVDLLESDEIYTKKGPVFQTAIIAGTQGAKQTSSLIPFCHPIGLDNCDIDISIDGVEAVVICNTKVTAKTGVEMEAITGATIAALTIYDMCKAMSHELDILSTRLLKKTGGGRIAAHEIMIGTPAIRNLIREDKVAQMYSAIQTGQSIGMQTLDQYLNQLVTRGLINKSDAKVRAVNKEMFA